MDGRKNNLIHDFLEGRSKRFIIPVYQRNYDWRISHCKQLYEDLIHISRNQLSSHFFGSVVSVTQDLPGHLLIIDGQQRITTISLLILAISKLLDSGQIHSSKRSSQLLYEDYLIDKGSHNEAKLISVEDDRKAYERLISSSEDEFIDSSNMTTNYRYFTECILKGKGEISPDELFDALEKLEIISISLNRESDNPQKIFESLNSTGLDLSEPDKIRNFLLMNISDAELQNQYYRKYWYQYEKLSGSSERLTGFINNYLIIKLGKSPRKIGQLYFDFKKYVQGVLEEGQTLDSILEDILKYAVLFNKICTANTRFDKVNRVLHRLNLLNIRTIDYYLLELFNYVDNNNVSEDSLVDILIAIESYLFRRSVCNAPTNSLKSVFLLLHKDALRNIADNNYAEVVKYILLTKTGSAKFPTDNEFTQAIDEHDFYNIRYRMYLFDRLENGDSVEGVQGAIAKKMEVGELSIEHIMPQHLSKVWADQLGSNCSEIHKQWLHKIANLTITGYNNQYSNKPFLEKRDAPNGFKESHLTLNKEIATCEKWGVEELEKRQSDMIAYFLELWPLPSTAYKPQTPIMEIHSLDEDEDFYTNRSIQAFSIQGLRNEIYNWTDLFKKILKYLYQEDPTILKKLAMETEGVAGNFKTERLSDNYYDIAPGVFVWVSTNTAAKIGLLKQLFPLYGLDGSEFEVEILANNDN